MNRTHINIKIPNILSMELVTSITYECDYVLISNEEYNLFGYGDTLEDAIDMFEDDLHHLKEDLFEGRINKNNTNIKQIRALTKLFRDTR